MIRKKYCPRKISICNVSVSAVSFYVLLSFEYKSHACFVDPLDYTYKMKE